MGWLERLVQDSTKLEYDREQDEALHTQRRGWNLKAGKQWAEAAGRALPLPLPRGTEFRDDSGGEGGSELAFHQPART